MKEYIDRKHFDERVRIAIGMSEGELTEDFKDGVLFVLELLKTEDKANVIEITKGATNGNIIKTMFPNIENDTTDLTKAFNNLKRWWNAPYKRGEEK